MDKKIGKIQVDRNLCIGAGSCTAITPEVFALDNDNKAIIVNPNANTDDNILLSAQSCPTNAILLYDEEGNKLYPA